MTKYFRSKANRACCKTAASKTFPQSDWSIKTFFIIIHQYQPIGCFPLPITPSRRLLYPTLRPLLGLETMGDSEQEKADDVTAPVASPPTDADIPTPSRTGTSAVLAARRERRFMRVDFFDRKSFMIIFGVFVASLILAIIIGATGPDTWHTQTFYAFNCGADGDHTGEPCEGGFEFGVRWGLGRGSGTQRRARNVQRMPCAFAGVNVNVEQCYMCLFLCIIGVIFGSDADHCAAGMVVFWRVLHLSRHLLFSHF